MIYAVCIGDELLDGRVSDANVAWLAREVGERGQALAGVLFVPDEQVRIIDALEHASQSGDIVVVCGGLGPTADDRTREAAAAWVGAPLESDLDLLDKLRTRFEARGYPFTQNNRRQCTFPATSRRLQTEVGTAAGFMLEARGARAYFVPGVPREFRWFCGRYVLPEIDRGADLASRTWSFFGLGESALENRLEGIDALAAAGDARLSYRADFPVIQVTIKAADSHVIDSLQTYLLARLGDWLVGEGEQTLAARVGHRLETRGETLTVAESCTGGWLGRDITSVPGSSAWFERGFLTYSNEAKVEELGVLESTLRKFGAVSGQVVCQMAEGARRRAGATYGLAISGIAGPSGGSASKPVGTVDLGLAAPDGVWRRRVHFRGRSRDQVRELSVYAALSLLLAHIEEHQTMLERVDGPLSPAEVFRPNGAPFRSAQGP